VPDDGQGGRDAMAKIRCNADVRELLYELDLAFEQYHECSRILADPLMSEGMAIAEGLNREAMKTWILGIANRINRASKGLKGLYD
jgi:hypothetical protein